MRKKEDLIKAFGKRVKTVREHLRFKQKDFARSIGMAGSYLSEIKCCNCQETQGRVIYIIFFCAPVPFTAPKNPSVFFQGYLLPYMDTFEVSFPCIFNPMACLHRFAGELRSKSARSL